MIDEMHIKITVDRASNYTTVKFILELWML